MGYTDCSCFAFFERKEMVIYKANWFYMPGGKLPSTTLLLAGANTINRSQLFNFLNNCSNGNDSYVFQSSKANSNFYKMVLGLDLLFGDCCFAAIACGI